VKTTKNSPVVRPNGQGTAVKDRAGAKRWQEGVPRDSSEVQRGTRSEEPSVMVGRCVSHTAQPPRNDSFTALCGAERVRGVSPKTSPHAARMQGWVRGVQATIERIGPIPKPHLLSLCAS
jgi:hypothetical protein